MRQMKMVAMLARRKDQLVNFFDGIEDTIIEKLLQFNNAVNTARVDKSYSQIFFLWIIVYTIAILAGCWLLLYIPYYLFFVLDPLAPEKARDPKQIAGREEMKTHRSFSSTSKRGEDQVENEDQEDVDVDAKAEAENDQKQENTATEDVYEGELNEVTGDKEGYGIMKYKNGTIYEGNWQRKPRRNLYRNRGRKPRTK